jgi:predicted nucleic acid-binding protein
LSDIRWVVNASPIISLAKISQVHILPKLCADLLIPQAVAQEIEDGPEDDPAKQWLRTFGKQWVKDIGMVSPIIAAWDLGAGETEVLSWAYQHHQYQVVVDDLAARKCAQILGISLCGTIGVIVIAKKKGKIPGVKPLLTQLSETAFRVDDRLFQVALSLAGEHE